MNNLKLSLDLVPASSWANNVRAILTKAQWDVLRGIVAARAWNICEICGGVGPKHPVECHEIWEYNEKTQIQRLAGMVALCPDCHSVKHYGFSQVQGKEKKALAHFMKVNNLKKKEAEKEINKYFEIWQKRSLLNWELDLSILEEYGIDVSKLKGSHKVECK